MCSLCGVLTGRRHWSERRASPEVFFETRDATVGRERQETVQLVNRILAPHRLRLSGWSGDGYVLRGATGRSEMVANLSQIWPAAERLSRRGCDPLDEDYLQALADSSTS